MAHPIVLPDDFREFLQLLADNHVEFLVVGGHAVSFHGYPRFTHDVDLVVMPSLTNGKRLENKRAVARPEDLADVARLTR